MKQIITTLGTLKEGDKFQFCEENGKLKSEDIYYVEGQYPKFGCTTVINSRNIIPEGNMETSYEWSYNYIWHKDHNYNKEEFHTAIVTAVENVQFVKLLSEMHIHICHRIRYTRIKDIIYK